MRQFYYLTTLKPNKPPSTLVQGTVGNTQEGNHVVRMSPGEFPEVQIVLEKTLTKENLTADLQIGRILRRKHTGREATGRSCLGKPGGGEPTQWILRPWRTDGSDGSRRTPHSSTRGWSRLAYLEDTAGTTPASALNLQLVQHATRESFTTTGHTAATWEMGHWRSLTAETVSVTSPHIPSPSVTSDKITSFSLEALKHFTPCLRSSCAACIMGLRAHVQFFLLKEFRGT